MSDLDLSKYDGHTEWCGNCGQCGLDWPCDAALLLAEVRRLREERRTSLLDFENLEAAVCPEDVGFDECINLLRKELTALRQSHARLLALVKLNEHRSCSPSRCEGWSTPCTVVELRAAVAEAEAL